MKHTPFKRVALMGRRRASKIPETVIAIRDYLQSLNVDTVIELHTAEAINERELPHVDPKNLNQHADLIILVGGDGSMINAAHIAVLQNLPVVGINRGRLGFLTDIHPDEMAEIAAVIQGDYLMEERFLLNAHLQDEQNNTLQRHMALNDIVISAGQTAHMIDFEIHIDGEYMATQRADGLIISTPTGSTAYALSAGGPIIKPSLEAVVLVPMFPHTLSSRPMVIPANSRIEITLPEDLESTPSLSCDGQESIRFPHGGKLTVTQLENKLKLVHPSDYRYFDTVRTKLDWHHYKKRS